MGRGGSKTWLFVGLGCAALGLLMACVATGVGVWLLRRQQKDDRFAELSRGAGGLVEPVGDEGPASLPPAFRPVTGAGYSFAVPAQWADMPSDQTLASIGSPTQIAGFYPNVNLVSEPFGGDLDTYVANARQQLSSMGATVVAQRASSLGALPAVDLELRTSQSVVLQRAAVRRSKGWVMTCSGGPGTMELIRVQCSQILDTLRVY